MKKCKICEKNLFENITFSNMFRINYEVHQKCIDELQFNFEEEVIPIESNIIIYDYVFNEINEGNNEEYLWFKFFIIAIDKHSNTGMWSMIILYDENIEKFFRDSNPFLLINLSTNPILLISLKKMNAFYLEGI